MSCNRGLFRVSRIQGKLDMGGHWPWGEVTSSIWLFVSRSVPLTTQVPCIGIAFLSETSYLTRIFQHDQNSAMLPWSHKPKEGKDSTTKALNSTPLRDCWSHLCCKNLGSQKSSHQSSLVGDRDNMNIYGKMYVLEIELNEIHFHSPSQHSSSCHR